MKMTPLEIRTQQFRHKLRGIDPEHVQSFLESVADQMEGLARERLQLQQRLADATARVDEMRSREHQVREVLVTAKKAADDTLEAAERTRKARLREAKAESDEIVARARQERSILATEVAELKRQRDRMRTELKSVLRSHAELLMRTAQSEYDQHDASDLAVAMGDESPVVCDLGGGDVDDGHEAEVISVHSAAG